MPRIPPRLVGILLIAASGGSILAHRSVYEAARQGPAQTAEFALGLLTFLLTSMGMLLIVHGGRLFERRVADAASRVAAADIATRLTATITQPGRAYDTRHGASLMQARHAIRASRRPETRQDVDVRP